MITALVIIASISAYAFVGGYVGMWLYSGRFDRCKDCRSGHRCYDWHAGPALLSAVVWPLALPVLAGGMAADRERKASRADLKHKRRLEILAAERSLAHEQANKTMADIKFLAEHGIKAEVPGLYEEQS
ncbi:hypothetical protein [Mycobacterium phage WXIN]|nr:hypothetical protein [Mycobacterium phage WXIN]